MSRTFRNLVLGLTVLLGLCGSALALTTATITVNGAEQPGDTSTITISFNGFVETAHYGQFSTPASIASTFGAMFSNDYLRLGLCAHATGNLITFQLNGAATFGTVDITGSTTSFQMNPSGFSSTVSKIMDTGTVTLMINGVLAATTDYGDGATPSSIAEGLAAGVTSGSFVNVTAVNNAVYIEAKQAGAGTDYTYSLQTTRWDSTDFPQPSFAPPPTNPITGSLDGGANASSGQTPQTIYSYTVPSGGYDADNNLTNYSDSVMGSWSFGYDTLNRLATAQNTAVGAPSSQYAGNYGCWSYDAFGNRTAQAMSTTPCANNPPLMSWAKYYANNQFKNTSQAMGGVGYDAAGNVTNDGNNTYLYDPEGRLCAVSSTLVGGITVMTGYLFDAEGRRVAKGNIQTWGSCNPAVNGFQVASEHDYILGPSGEQVTEMAMDANNSMTWQHTNVWANGKLLATYDLDGVHFHLTDPLGTRRAQTDYAGVSEQTCSNLPFGDALACTGSSIYPTEQHFTGKERDSESGNDYFGARYYASSMGRFMSPDPSQLYYADPNNPQSFNLYAYVQNNPLVNVDPNGLDCVYFNDDQSVNHVLSGDCASTQDNGYYIDATGVNNATLNDNGDLTSYSTGDGSFLADGTPNDSSVTVSASTVDPDEERIAGLALGVTADTKDFMGLLDTVGYCTASAYGLAPAGAAVATKVAGTAVPKASMGLRHVPLGGTTSPNTTILGGAGERAFLAMGMSDPKIPGAAGRLMNKMTGTARVFGSAGRIAEHAEPVMWGIDAASIGYCVAKHAK